MWTSQRSLLWREGREWHCGVVLWQALFLSQPSTAPTYIRPFSQKLQLWQSKLSCTRAQSSSSFHLARQGINKTSLGSMAASSSELHLAIGRIHGLERRPSQSCEWPFLGRMACSCGRNLTFIVAVDSAGNKSSIHTVWIHHKSEKKMGIIWIAEK